MPTAHPTRTAGNGSRERAPMRRRTSESSTPRLRRKSSTRTANTSASTSRNYGTCPEPQLSHPGNTPTVIRAGTRHPSSITQRKETSRCTVTGPGKTTSYSAATPRNSAPPRTLSMPRREATRLRPNGFCSRRASPSRRQIPTARGSR